MEMTEGLIQELMNFLDSSLTSYHAVENIEKTLLQAAFTALSEKKLWTLDQGGSYFVARNDSSVMAFRLPDCELGQIKGFHVYAAHSDSPAFKVKENPELNREGVYVSVNTEPYGKMILSTWLDRPLTIAGRVCVEEAGEIVTKTVRLKDNLCMIPNLAIHMNANMNSGVAFSAQSDMLPLLTMGDPAHRGSASKGTLCALLADALGTQDILSYDLYVENCERAVLAGAKDEFIMTPRYDDLACVFAGLQGLLQGKPSQYIDVLAVFDNEEVGSLTRQGADSTFFRDTLENIAAGLGVDSRIYRTWMADSLMISADNGHACHPNQGGKADPTNRPYLNNGVVLKYHGGQKYATDAFSAAYVKRLCRDNDIPLQFYANNSDIPGGRTLGNLAMTQVSMAAADIGLPQLAMHSPYETAGVKDTYYLIQAAEKFFK